MSPGGTSFKGNKASLPSKPCVGCGRTMSWRKSWAKNWVEVKFCSDACRRSARATSSAAAPLPAAQAGDTQPEPGGTIRNDP